MSHVARLLPNRSALRLGSFLIPFSLLIHACAPSGAPVDTTAGSTAPIPTVASTIAASGTETTPTPLAAWPLRGDGRSSVGDVDLVFEGGYTLTDDGVAFDGVTGKAMTQGPSPLDTTKSFTVSVWVSYQDLLVDEPIVLIQAAGNGQSFRLGVAGPVWMFGTTETIFNADASRSDDWVHLAGVSDLESGMIRFLLNGELIEEGEVPPPKPASGPLVIGERWAGAVADLALYQTALDADEITAIYETTRPDAPSPRWIWDPSIYADGVLDGTWDYVMSEAADSQLLTQLRKDYGAKFSEATIRLGFDGARWWQGVVIDGELWLEDAGLPAGDGGIIQITGHELAVRNEFGIQTYGWELDGDELTLAVINECNTDGDKCLTGDEIDGADPFVRLVIEHTFTKNGDDAGL